MRNVNAVLRRNRTVLERLNTKGKTKTHKDRLLKEGFDFQFLTHIYTTKAGDEYRFCYEQGYLPVGNDFYLLVKREEE